MGRTAIGNFHPHRIQGAEAKGRCLSGPYLDDKLKSHSASPGDRARCTTEQLKSRFGVRFGADGKTAEVHCMGKVSQWVKIQKDTWEKTNND
jgi:hypothetical protein